MSGITLANPVAAMSEKIAQPFDDAAPIVRRIANLYREANQRLEKNHQTLIVTFQGLGADAFTNMIGKQTNWVNNITHNIDSLAGFYEDCARHVREAAQAIESAIGPFMEIVQWVVDRLTPDIVVKQGESAVRAVFNDMKAQVHRELHDAGSFFSHVAHLHFGSALHDVVDGVKGLGHLTEDVIGLIAAVEPYLCQWAADVYQWVNWLQNKLNDWGLGVADWLLGISDIAYDTAVFTDPNSTAEEKWLAGIDMGINVILDIGMAIPGADLVALTGKGVFKLLGKFGLKELLDAAAKRVVARIADSVASKIVKDIVKKFEQKIAQKFSQRIVERMLKRDLTKKALKNLQALQPKIAEALLPHVQAIIEALRSGKITLAEAQARIQALEALADKYKPKQLLSILERFSPDDLTKIVKHNIDVNELDKLIKETGGNLSDPSAVNLLIGPPGTIPEVAGKSVPLPDIIFRDSSGKIVLGRELKALSRDVLEKGIPGKDVLKAVSQLERLGPDVPKQVVIHVPNEITESHAKELLKRFRRGEEAKKLIGDQKKIPIIILAPSGKQLAKEPLIP